MNIRKIIRNILKEGPYSSHVGNFPRVVNKEYEILAQLGKVFTSSPLTKDEVRFIRYKPIVRNGFIVSIHMQDANSEFGGLDTYFKESDAKEIGVRLDEIVNFLVENGARSITSMPRARWARFGSGFPD